MKNFPFRLLLWMTGLFTALFGAFIFILSLFENGEHFNLSNPVALIILAILAFVFSTVWSVLPLKRGIQFLTLLLNQPKTENIRVEEVDFGQSFQIGEWGEFGELVKKVERKLRRRTKALLRETTELSAVMNSLGSPIIAVNTDLRIAFLNSAFAVLFDFSLEDLGALKAKKINDLVPEKQLVETLQKALKDEFFETKFLHLKVAGKIRIFSVSMTPLRRRGDNSLYGVVASLDDETVKVELDQKRMDFVANASHELRTPIAAISTSVSLLKKIDDEETKKQIMESLDSNSERLVKLTHELLDLSKLEGEVEAVDLSVCDLKELTTAVVKNLPHHEKDFVELTFEATEATLDSSKVKQILANLIQNALLYTPDETKVLVTWSKDGVNTILKVKDFGQGVPEKDHDRLFERFYRVDRSRSRKLGGSGIGLSIVKHIMNLHGGEVRLSPFVKGEGAEFTCTFPLKKRGFE